MSPEGLHTLAELHAASRLLADERPHLDLNSPAGRIATLATMGRLPDRQPVRSGDTVFVPIGKEGTHLMLPVSPNETALSDILIENGEQ